MKKLLLIFLFSPAILIQITFAQPSMTWSRIYVHRFSADYAEAGCSSGNGFYYIGGQADSNFSQFGFVLKINEFGDSIWGKYLFDIGRIETMVGTPDGGCIVSGATNNATFIRLDPNGNIVWVQSYGNGVTFIQGMIKTNNGKFIACGVRNIEQDGVVVKFDINGTLDWLKMYPTGALKSLTSLEELPNGGYIVTGGDKDFPDDSNKTLLMRIDDTGNIVWEKKYLIFGKDAHGGFIKKTNNEFFVAGRTTDTANVPEFERNYFIRTDTSGNVIFTKLFEFFKRDFFITAQYINDNRFIFSSFAFSQINSNDTSYNRVFITDTLGNITASRNFITNIGLNQFYSILESPNHDLICSGFTTSGDSYDFLACRIDSNLIGSPIGIKKITYQIPEKFKLYQNFPNPFNPSTKIKFDLPKSGQVKMILYNVMGQEIQSLLDKNLQSGTYEVTLDMSDKPSGVYFYKLVSGDFSLSKKMVLVK